MMQITENPRRQHERREDAERAVEIFYPGRYLYSVTEHHCVTRATHTFVVKVYNRGPMRFLGYAWDPEEEGDEPCCFTAADVFPSPNSAF